MVTVTFIRHGESEDNPKNIWAGWKDAPLSELGQKQALALARSFSNVPISHIYTSPLKRAHSTGLAVHTHQLDPKPTFTASPHLREQHFGAAEGNPWVLSPPPDLENEDLYSRGIYPVLYGRHEKFPDGESLDDLARRCEVGIKECVLPHVHEDDEVHVALTSHGLCISELLGALIRLDPHAKKEANYTGLFNTGWTRVQVRVREGHDGPVDAHNPPPLEVKVTHVNNTDHLADLVQPPVASKEDARAFFGGASNL